MICNLLCSFFFFFFQKEYSYIYILVEWGIAGDRFKGKKKNYIQRNIQIIIQIVILIEGEIKSSNIEI